MATSRIPHTNRSNRFDVLLQLIWRSTFGFTQKSPFPHHSITSRQSMSFASYFDGNHTKYYRYHLVTYWNNPQKCCLNSAIIALLLCSSLEWLWEALVLVRFPPKGSRLSIGWRVPSNSTAPRSKSLRFSTGCVSCHVSSIILQSSFFWFLVS